MENRPFNPKAFIKTISIIHLALVGGLVVFMIFTYLQNKRFSAVFNQEDVFIYIVPVIAAAGYFGSQFMFKKLLSNISKEESLQKKLTKYFTASIVKFALIEGPAFIALFAYFNSGNALHFAIAICLIAYLIVQKPTVEKIKSHLRLSMEESRQLN